MKFRFSLCASLAVVAIAGLLRADPIAPAGAELAKTLDSMDVEHPGAK